MAAGPIRGKLPDRPISAFKGQDTKYHILVLTIRIVIAESVGGWERVVDLGNRSMKRRQTA